MDALQALTLQLAWGADEFLLPTPQDRRADAAPVAAPVMLPVTPSMQRPKPVAAAALPAGPAEAARIAAGCNTLAELRAALEGFNGCALKDTATQLVFADGVEDARLMLVGEAPGGEEDRTGRPFAGPAGQLLDKMLGSIGVDRTTIRIVNMVPWRPPGNRVPSESEIAVCLPFLHRHIALVKPQALLLLGGVSTKAMLGPQAGGAGIRRLRGQWRRLEIPGLADPLPCLPTYHPAYLLRTASAKRESWVDFIAVRQWLAGGDLKV